MRRAQVVAMKALLPLAVLFLSGAAFAQPSVPVETEIPMLLVRTSLASRRDVPSITSGGWSQTQTVRSTGILVDYHFFRGRKTPFEIQCFFIAKNDSTKKRYIYDTVLWESKEPINKMDFSGAPLIGSGKQWVDLPILGNYADLSSLLETLTFSNETTGSHGEGWIVRFVSGGMVLTVNSNQPYLFDLARQIPKFFDATADAARRLHAPAIPPPQ
jgi:hypothetical protein